MKTQRRSPGVTGVQIASSGKPLFEPRLLGTWKSDRRKTFENAIFPKMSPKQLRKFRSLFGKMVVTWTRTTVSSYFDCDRFMGFPNNRTPEVEKYAVVARDAGCVVICLKGHVPNPKSKIGASSYAIMDELNMISPLRTIQFDGDRGYRVSLGTFFEYFQRID
jgi:hypothetical protein